MIDATHDLPIRRQAELLEVSHSNVYYLTKATSEADLAVMRRIDELHLNYPFAGARMLRDMLNREGIPIGRKHVSTLMGKIGIAAIYRKRNTSVPHPKHPVYPYLLKNLTIDIVACRDRAEICPPHPTDRHVAAGDELRGESTELRADAEDVGHRGLPSAPAGARA